MLLIVVLIQQHSKKARVAVAHCINCRLEERLVYVMHSYKDVRNVISNSRHLPDALYRHVVHCACNCHLQCKTCQILKKQIAKKETHSSLISPFGTLSYIAVCKA